MTRIASPTPGPGAGTLALQTERYVSLRSYKRDGGPVTIPVWCTRHGDRLVFITDANSVKVKRMRRNPQIQVAGCNANGKQVHTEYFEGTAEIVDDPAWVEAGRRDVRAKYGWQMWLVEKSLRFRGLDAPVLVELDVGTPTVVS